MAFKISIRPKILQNVQTNGKTGHFDSEFQWFHSE